ncbi:unnamed protein product [Microthlaspi erraticum]|uniref:Zinc knuckle CX2CX4HX4C domain-containing protein n=1 Tax=Microthlaspi erraticum TaxID=1685480 RepID=A0A6D2KK15_9BRAS|nr:unnamed protein product [Microthlaspi erraticum]
MVSLVRWQPDFDPFYPSEITFWVRVLNLPLQVWAELTLRSIGEAMGEVKDVDVVGGRFQVSVNGFTPLHFETTLEAKGGREIPVVLRYERLFGFCKECLSLCHDVEMCPLLHAHRAERDRIRRREEKTEARAQSYREAVQASYGNGGNGGRAQYEERRGDYKGKAKVVESSVEQGRGQMIAE